MLTICFAMPSSISGRILDYIYSWADEIWQFLAMSQRCQAQLKAEALSTLRHVQTTWHDQSCLLTASAGECHKCQQALLLIIC